MDNLATLPLNELLELARVAQHKREKHNEAMKRYYAKNMDKWRETWRNQKRKKKQEQEPQQQLI